MSAASLLSAQTPDTKIIHRWPLAGDPRGIAVGADGTLYAGLAQPQAIVAIDPKTGATKKRVVLDSAEIASTKELVTLRTNRGGTMLYVANGSDESATILALPELRVVREITTEGEPIRDVLPDPKGRYVYLLGRRVHVYDARGEKELHTIPIEQPEAIAATDTALAVASGGSVTVFDVPSFKQRERFQAVAGVRALAYARSLIALSSDTLVETGGTPRTNSICLPPATSAQVAAVTPAGLLLFVEGRCQSSTPSENAASLYGVNASAIAYDPASNTLVATDRDGYLTIYRVPRAAMVH